MCRDGERNSEIVTERLFKSGDGRKLNEEGGMRNKE